MKANEVTQDGHYWYMSRTGWSVASVDDGYVYWMDSEWSDRVFELPDDMVFIGPIEPPSP